MRVAIACGGTGGHFYPGYALARELRKRGHESLFVLRDGDPARRLLEAGDWPSVAVKLRGLERRPSPSWISFLPAAAAAVLKLRRAFRAYRPAVCVGMGAYLTGAAATAARMTDIPVVLHEANAALGLANRLAAPFARAVALGLPLEGGRARAILTGTPIREELHARMDKAAARKALGLDPATRTVLILGGSQGASALNRHAPAALALLKGRVQAYHLCGKGKLEETRAAYGALVGAVPFVAAEFEDAMARAYGAADAVVCRAGAGTAAELLAQELPAVLIPYPRAAGDHQAANARALQRAGIGPLLREEKLSAASLAEALAALPGPTAGAAAALGLPPASESAARLADVVEDCLKALG